MCGGPRNSTVTRNKPNNASGENFMNVRRCLISHFLTNLVCEKAVWIDVGREANLTGAAFYADFGRDSCHSGLERGGGKRTGAAGSLPLWRPEGLARTCQSGGLKDSKRASKRGLEDWQRAFQVNDSHSRPVQKGKAVEGGSRLGKTASSKQETNLAARNNKVDGNG